MTLSFEHLHTDLILHTLSFLELKFIKFDSNVHLFARTLYGYFTRDPLRTIFLLYPCITFSRSICNQEKYNLIIKSLLPHLYSVVLCNTAPLSLFDNCVQQKHQQQQSQNNSLGVKQISRSLHRLTKLEIQYTENYDYTPLPEEINKALYFPCLQSLNFAQDDYYAWLDYNLINLLLKKVAPQLKHFELKQHANGYKRNINSVIEMFPAQNNQVNQVKKLAIFIPRNCFKFSDISTRFKQVTYLYIFSNSTPVEGELLSTLVQLKSLKLFATVTGNMEWVKLTQLHTLETHNQYPRINVPSLKNLKLSVLEPYVSCLVDLNSITVTGSSKQPQEALEAICKIPSLKHFSLLSSQNTTFNNAKLQVLDVIALHGKNLESFVLQHHSYGRCIGNISSLIQLQNLKHLCFKPDMRPIQEDFLTSFFKLPNLIFLETIVATEFSFSSLQALGSNKTLKKLHIDFKTEQKDTSWLQVVFEENKSLEEIKFSVKWTVWKRYCEKDERNMMKNETLKVCNLSIYDDREEETAETVPSVQDICEKNVIVCDYFST